MIGRTNTGGGGGSGGLNFKVVGYATEAELLADTPKENTIGIITTNKITGWLFSATEPESPTEGMVWISTGSSSAVEFNALKKNGIQVYPLSAKQYVSGAWVDVTAMSYQDSQWVDWFTYIIKDGNAGNWGFSTQLRTQCTFPITQKTGYINIKGYSNYVSGGLVDTKIDVTNISAIEMDIDAVTIGSVSDDFSGFVGMSLILTDSAKLTTYDKAVSAIKAYKNTRTSGRQTLTLDVSSMSGQYYVGIALGSLYSNPSDKENDVASVNLYNIKYSQSEVA